MVRSSIFKREAVNCFRSSSFLFLFALFAFDFLGGTAGQAPTQETRGALAEERGEGVGQKLSKLCNKVNSKECQVECGCVHSTGQDY